MRWVARTRFLFWLALVATVPPVVLDLTSSTWAPVTILAGVFGFPYYAAQSVLPIQRLGAAPGIVEIVLSAILGLLPFVLAHFLIARRYGRSSSIGAPAA
jgi:hypothetical protein